MIIASNCTSIVVTGNIVGGLKEAKLSNYNQIIEAKQHLTILHNQFLGFKSLLISEFIRTTNGHSLKKIPLRQEVAPRTKGLKRQCSAGLQQVDHGGRPLAWRRSKQHEPHFAVPERQKMCTGDPVYEMVEENTREKKKRRWRRVRRDRKLK